MQERSIAPRFSCRCGCWPNCELLSFLFRRSSAILQLFAVPLPSSPPPLAVINVMVATAVVPAEHLPHFIGGPVSRHDSSSSRARPAAERKLRAPRQHPFNCSLLALSVRTDRCRLCCLWPAVGSDPIAHLPPRRRTARSVARGDCELSTPRQLLTYTAPLLSACRLAVPLAARRIGEASVLCDCRRLLQLVRRRMELPACAGVGAAGLLARAGGAAQDHADWYVST